MATPTSSPTFQGNTDDDEPEFGKEFIIIGIVIVGVIFFIIGFVYVSTRPASKGLVTGDVIFWKDRHKKGEVVNFTMHPAKFEVHIFSTGRHEFLDPDQICRYEEGLHVELSPDEESGIELEDHKHKHDSQSRSRKAASHSKDKLGVRFQEEKHEDHKGHFRKDGTWDPGDGIHHAHHDRSHEHHETHLHTILNAKNAQGELAEALGISAAGAGEAHGLSVEKRRSIMGVGARGESKSPVRGRSKSPGPSSNHHHTHDDDKSLARVSSNKSLSGVGSDKSLPRVSSRSPKQGLHGDTAGSTSRSRDGSKLRDRSATHIRDPRPGVEDDSAQMKKVSSHNGLKQASKSTSRSNSASRDRSTSNGRRGSGGEPVKNHHHHPDIKHELRTILSGEVDEFLNDEIMKGKGTKM